MDGPEALAWLRLNQNPGGFAGERFRSRQDAVRFVEWLYALGAERVVVPNLAIRDDSITLKFEGGPYANALVVHLPEDPARREPLIWLCALEMDAQKVGSALLQEHVGCRQV